MNTSISKLLVLLIAVVPSVAMHSAEENHDAIIAEIVEKARAYLGGSDKLDSIKTISTSGVLVYGNGDSGTFTAVYKRPLYQQFTSTINGYKETSTLNRTEAWLKSEEMRDPGSWNLDFYEIDDIHHMQAKVREALSFLKKPSSRTGRISYVDTIDTDDGKVLVLDYVHSDRVWFRRTFNEETGRVISTLTDKGVIFEEYGEKVVNGIRFPEKIVTRFLTNQGEQVMEMIYTTIELNKEIDESMFKVPVMAAE